MKLSRNHSHTDVSEAGWRGGQCAGHQGGVAAELLGDHLGPVLVAQLEARHAVPRREGSWTRPR